MNIKKGENETPPAPRVCSLGMSRYYILVNRVVCMYVCMYVVLPVIMQPPG